MTQKIKLGSVIDQFAAEPPVPTAPTRVEFHLGTGIVVSRTNLSLRNMSDHVRIVFLRNFLQVWNDTNNTQYLSDTRKESLEELRKVFGHGSDHHVVKRLLFTLTADGRQFRSWYGLPGGVITPNHAESHGLGCLFEVAGEAKNVKEYVEALMLRDTDQQQSIVLPNRVKVWGLWWRFAQ